MKNHAFKAKLIFLDNTDVLHALGGGKVSRFVGRNTSYIIRHELKPGDRMDPNLLSGWASERDASRKLEYDLNYMKNISIAFDLMVIFTTVKTVVFEKRIQVMQEEAVVMENIRYSQ